MRIFTPAYCFVWAGINFILGGLFLIAGSDPLLTFNLHIGVVFLITGIIVSLGER